jgi:excisionase family DNA binding protein
VFTKESYSPTEIQRLLGIDKNRVYRAVAYGELEGFRNGGRWIVPKPAIREWLLAGYNLNLDG